MFSNDVKVKIGIMDNCKKFNIFWKFSMFCIEFLDDNNFFLV